MANHKSAAKRNRQTIKRTALNRAKKSRVKTSIKRLRTAIQEKNKDLAQKQLVEVQTLLSKLAKTSAIKKQTASRKTSRLASQVARL